MTALHGDVEEGFGRLADVFAENFERRNEIGAALALYVEGRLVADLWGGLASRDTGAP